MNDFISSNDPMALNFQHLVERLSRIEEMLINLAKERTAKEFYTTAEIAELLDRSEFTVREWCRNGRIYASKRLAGRGNSKEWMISHEELLRLQSEGLLPVPNSNSSPE